MEIVGWLTLDKNGLENFFNGKEQPMIIGGYMYARGDDLGKKLPTGMLATIFGTEANWHYGHSLFAVYA
jgi:hypothetical protein